MIIPSKYTIYHRVVNNDKYNNFIPRLYQGLEQRNIPVIRVYEDYTNYVERHDMDHPLYYGTDTHWTERGLNMALNNTLEEIRTINEKLN